MARESQSYDTCIAEAVADAYSNSLSSRSRGELFNFGGGVAARSEVELIRLGEELD